MKQPDLGKKIACLRIEKGMTQAELAQKCSVTVRTVQRIESAEVMPRSYTVKTIFAALGHDAYTADRISSPAAQMTFPEKLADLFNLKTNTMKKVMILSTPLVLVIGIFLAGQNGFAQNKKAEKALNEANDNFTSWFNSGKIEAVKSIYTDNACTVPGPTQEICGTENIKMYFQGLYDNGFRFVDLKSKSISITDTVAIDKGVWTATAGEKKISGTYLTQWRLVGDKWKIENESSNVDSDVSTTK